MYNTYNSLIHQLINDQNQHERLRQSEELEISQINREVREASSSHDNAIQSETKKVKDQIAQSKRELESKKQKYEATLKGNIEKMTDDTVTEVASTVVKKKTDILNGLINKLKTEQLQMMRKVTSEVNNKTDILNRFINKLKTEQLQMATEMKDTLLEQGSPTPPDLFKIGYRSIWGFRRNSVYDAYAAHINPYFHISGSIAYPIIGILLTVLSIFSVLLFSGTITIPNYLHGFLGLIFLLLLFYGYKYTKYDQGRKKLHAAALKDYNKRLEERQLDFDNIIAEYDPIVAFESNKLTEYLSPTSLEKCQALIKRYNENKATNDSLIKLRDSIGKGQEFDYLIAKSDDLSVALKSNDLTKNSLPTNLEDSKILIKRYKENEIKHDYLIKLRDSLSKANEVTKLRDKSAEITSKYYVDFGLTSTTQDIEIAVPTQDIMKAAPSQVIKANINIPKRKKKEEMGFAELVYWQKRNDDPNDNFLFDD